MVPVKLRLGYKDGIALDPYTAVRLSVYRPIGFQSKEGMINPILMDLNDIGVEKAE